MRPGLRFLPRAAFCLALLLLLPALLMPSAARAQLQASDPETAALTESHFKTYTQVAIGWFANQLCGHVPGADAPAFEAEIARSTVGLGAWLMAQGLDKSTALAQLMQLQSHAKAHVDINFQNCTRESQAAIDHATNLAKDFPAQLDAGE